MVRYITSEDLEIFEQERKLDAAARDAEKKFDEAVEKSRQGEIKFEDIYPLFEECIKLRKEWRKYFDEHVNILLAQAIK